MRASLLAAAAFLLVGGVTEGQTTQSTLVTPRGGVYFYNSTTSPTPRTWNRPVTKRQLRFRTYRPVYSPPWGGGMWTPAYSRSYVRTYYPTYYRRW